MNYVYRVEVEVAPMEGTQLPDDCAGAIVNVYIGATTIREAIDRVETELLDDCYKPIFTLAAFVLDLEEDVPETEEEGYPNKEDLVKIMNERDIWYGPFYTYPPEQKDIQ